MMVNATFNNISVISWRSVLYLEETGVPGENHLPVTLYKINIHYRNPSLQYFLRMFLN